MSSALILSLVGLVLVVILILTFAPVLVWANSSRRGRRVSAVD